MKLHQQVGCPLSLCRPRSHAPPAPGPPEHFANEWADFSCQVGLLTENQAPSIFAWNPAILNKRAVPGTWTTVCVPALSSTLA